MPAVGVAESASRVPHARDGTVSRAGSGEGRHGRAGALGGSGEVALDQLGKGLTDGSEPDHDAGEPVEDVLLQRAAEALDGVPYCQDGRAEAGELVPADGDGGHQGGDAGDDEPDGIGLHGQVHELLRLLQEEHGDVLQTGGHGPSLGYGVSHRHGRVIREDAGGQHGDDVDGRTDGRDEEVDALRHQLQRRDDEGLQDLVDLQERSEEFPLQLLEGAVRGLRYLLRHPVELAALTGGPLEGGTHHVEGDQALGHLVLQRRHGLACERGDVQERVVSGVDELQEILPLQLAGGADLAEDEGQLLELVLVAHGHVSEHLQVLHDRLGAHAEAEHGLRGLLGTGAVPESLVCVLVDLAEHLRRPGLVTYQDVEGGGRLLRLHAQPRHHADAGRHGHYRIGEELRAGQAAEGVAQASEGAGGESRGPVDRAQFPLDRIQPSDGLMVPGGSYIYDILGSFHGDAKSLSFQPRAGGCSRAGRSSGPTAGPTGCPGRHAGST